ncbi:MAG TPA: DNA translocase FtsK 4TM domain-containing protein, partial [Gemmatales bacterium]|nr:DNA translocase FtsK 4TM domain-containing protein [Gemmatales bacterium]
MRRKIARQGEGSRKPFRLRWRHVVAATLLLTWACAIVAVFCFHPHDGPSSLAVPANQQTSNILGLPGAWLANGLYHHFGWSIVPLLAVWFILGIAFLLPGRFGNWLYRLSGTMLLIPSTAVLAHVGQWPINVYWNPWSGGGGHLGNALYSWSSSYLSIEGVVLCFSLCALLGVVLALDVFWPMAQWFLAKLKCWIFTNSAVVARTINMHPMKPAALAGQETDADTIPIRHPETPRKVGKGKSAPQLRIVSEEEQQEENVDNDEEMEDSEDAGDTGTIPVTATLSIKELPSVKKYQIPVEDNSKLLSTLSADEVWKQEGEYQLPPLTVLEEPESPPYHQPEHEERLRARATKLEQIFADFGIDVRVVGINTEPVITQFE